MAHKFFNFDVRWVIIPLLAVLFVLQLVIQIRLAKEDSQTVDEAVHLSAGYTYLTRGDYRFNPEHPPLVKYLAALPLLWLKPNSPVDNQLWTSAGHFYYDAYGQNSNFGYQFLYYSHNDADQLLFWGRFGPILLTLFFGLILCATAVLAFGWWAGLITTILYVFDPLIAGHGHLITTDIGASFGYFVSLMALWYFIKKPSWKTVLGLGLTVGLAQLMKFTDLALVPIIPILYLWYLIQHRPSAKTRWVRLGQLVTAGVIAVMVIWAGYGFHRSTLPFDTGFNESGQVISQPTNGALQQMHNFPAAFSWLPLPYDYIRGAAMVLNHTGGGHPSFLLGESGDKGWWYYFPIIILFKTPLISLGLILTSLFQLIRRREPWSLPLIATVGAGWFLLVGMMSHADLGLRHIMPIYPLLFLLVGYTFTTISRPWRMTWLGLLAILGVQFSFAYPYYLSYFNELAGGSYNGYKIATDSNLDWSQDVKRIKTYVDNHSFANPPFVIYYWDGEGVLDYYGIKRQPSYLLTPNASGYVIIGASILQSPNYQWIKTHTKVDQISPGVLVYNLDEP